MNERNHFWIDCEEQRLAATLDCSGSDLVLLIVGGGNELRGGAHGNMAQLAAELAHDGISVLRYDRRGVGESSGANDGFLSSGEDIQSAIAACRTLVPTLRRLVAFGNCDAATALALFGGDLNLDACLLANPWLYEGQEAPPPTAQSGAVRARYRERLRDPRFYRDLIGGKVSFTKGLRGLRSAAKKQQADPMAIRFRDALLESAIPTSILLAERDTTARTFRASWDGADFGDLREGDRCTLHSLDSASHGFSGRGDRDWLKARIRESFTG